MVRIAQTTWALRIREMYCLELVEASQTGRNASADGGDGHTPSESKERSQLVKSEIKGA